MLLKQIHIFEGSFDYTGAKPPHFTQIKDFLEKHNGKWVYKDYLEEDEAATIEEVGKMKPLKLMRCKEK